VNCHRIHQKSLNFIHPFKFYSNFTNKNVRWLHFSWATQYMETPRSWRLKVARNPRLWDRSRSGTGTLPSW